MLKLLINALFFTLFFNSYLNASNDILYKDYVYGMSKDILLKEEGVYDCSQSFEDGALCKDNQKFVDEDVDLGFSFINDKLIAVTLFTDFTTDNYIKFISAINSKFQLITIESNEEKIDFLEEIRKSQKADFLKNVSDFEQKALNSGHIKYSFIDKEIYKELVKSSTNAVEMILNSNENTRIVVYEINETQDSIYAGITFTLPKKTLLMINKKQKYENF